MQQAGSSNGKGNADLDELDTALISALEGDVRRPTQDLAKQLGVGGATIKRRIERLLQLQRISLSPMVDLRAIGRDYLLVIGIDVEQSSPEDVAHAIADLPMALTVNIALGHHDIELVAALEDRESVSALLAETLPSIKGVGNLAPSMALDVWKFQSAYDPHSPASHNAERPKLDSVDKNIIRALQPNARKSNRSVAAELNVSESMVRARIHRMQKEKQINFDYVQSASGSSAKAALVGVDVLPGCAAKVCHALAMIPEISFVSTMLGRHDIICSVRTPALEALTEILHSRIAPIEGVRRTVPSHCLKQLKHQISLGLIL